MGGYGHGCKHRTAGGFGTATIKPPGVLVRTGVATRRNSQATCCDDEVPENLIRTVVFPSGAAVNHRVDLKVVPGRTYQGT